MPAALTEHNRYEIGLRRSFSSAAILPFGKKTCHSFRGSSSYVSLADPSFPFSSSIVARHVEDIIHSLPFVHIASAARTYTLHRRRVRFIFPSAWSHRQTCRPCTTLNSASVAFFHFEPGERKRKKTKTATNSFLFTIEGKTNSLLCVV